MSDRGVQRRIPGLIYADIEAAQKFLVEVFGMEAGELARADDGTVVHGEVTAGDGPIWLHQAEPEYRLQTSKTAGADTAILSIMVDDVDAHHEHARQAGAVVVYEPTDMPYEVREYGVRDLESRLWSFMSPID